MHGIQQLSRSRTPSTANGIWNRFQFVYPRPQTSCDTFELHTSGITAPWDGASLPVWSGRGAITNSPSYAATSYSLLRLILHRFEKNPDTVLLSIRLIFSIHSPNGKCFSWQLFSYFLCGSFRCLLRCRDVLDVNTGFILYAARYNIANL